MTIFVALIIGVMIVCGFIFNANRTLPNERVATEVAIARKGARWITFSILVILFCLLIGIGAR